MSHLLKSCSFKPLGDHSLEDEEYVEKGEKMVKWKMPKVPTHTIFEERRKMIFKAFSSNPSIKSTEAKLSFGKDGGAFKLYSQAPSSYGGKGKQYNKMNIGLVQIGLKTLTKKIPPKAKIIVCLRDNRVDKIEDSILGLVESNLRDGPFYFNVFPNINLSLSACSSYIVSLTHVLSVHVLVKGFDQLPKGSEPIVLTCRTCYKLNPNSFGPEALLESPVGKNVFFQTKILGGDKDHEDHGGGGVVQKVTIWDKVELPCDWPPQLQVKNVPYRLTTINGTSFIRMSTNQ